MTVQSTLSQNVTEEAASDRVNHSPCALRDHVDLLVGLGPTEMMTFFILIDSSLPLEVGERPGYDDTLYNKTGEVKGGVILL